MRVQRMSDGRSVHPQRKHIAPGPAPRSSGNIWERGWKYCKSWRSGRVAVNQCLQAIGQSPNTRTHSGGIANTRPTQEKTRENPNTDRWRAPCLRAWTVEGCWYRSQFSSRTWPLLGCPWSIRWLYIHVHKDNTDWPLWEENRKLGGCCDQRRHLEIFGEGMWCWYDQNIVHVHEIIE